MARPLNSNKNQYIVFLKRKGTKSPCKSLLNTHNCYFITVHAITAIEAFTQALNISRENSYLKDSGLIPYHIRLDKDINRLNYIKCKDKYL